MNRPSFQDITPGGKLVIVRQTSPRDFAVATPVTGDRKELAGLTTTDGRGISYTRRLDEEGVLLDDQGGRWWLYFTLPLPEGTDGDLVEYARILRGEPSVRPPAWTGYREWDETCAFVVEALAADHFHARMVSRVRAWSGPDENGVDRLSYETLDESDVVFGTKRSGGFWTTEDRAIIEKSCLAHDVHIGDVVVATGLSVKLDDDLELTSLENPAILPFRATSATLDLVFPSNPRDIDDTRTFPREEHLKLAPPAKWVFERECARRSTEQDIALLVAIPDAANPGADSERIGIIAHSGAVIFRNRNEVHEGLVTSGGIQPGIAVMTAPRFWAYRCHEGEYDSGFDFETRPAVQEDLEFFSIGIADLGSAIRDFLEADEDEELHSMDDLELGRRFMAMGELVPSVSGDNTPKTL